MVNRYDFFFIVICDNIKVLYNDDDFIIQMTMLYNDADLSIKW